MGRPDVRGMAPLCAAFVQAYDVADPTLLAPFLAPDCVFVGLVADHAGAPAVLQALFGAGERRACKPQKALAELAADGAGAYDMVIQSQELWSEQMYLDSVTVAGGQVTRVVRRCLTGVTGGAESSLDGREKYRLSGRGATAEEANRRVTYTWAAERFLCEGFTHLLPPGPDGKPLAPAFDNA